MLKKLVMHDFDFFLSFLYLLWPYSRPCLFLSFSDVSICSRVICVSISCWFKQCNENKTIFHVSKHQQQCEIFSSYFRRTKHAHLLQSFMVNCTGDIFSFQTNLKVLYNAIFSCLLYVLYHTLKKCNIWFCWHLLKNHQRKLIILIQFKRIFLY